MDIGDQIFKTNSIEKFTLDQNLREYFIQTLIVTAHFRTLGIDTILLPVRQKPSNSRNRNYSNNQNKNHSNNISQNNSNKRPNNNYYMDRSRDNSRTSNNTYQNRSKIYFQSLLRNLHKQNQNYRRSTSKHQKEINQVQCTN